MRERYAGSSRGFHTFEEALAYFLEAIQARPTTNEQAIDVSLVVHRERHPVPEHNYWSVDSAYFAERPS
jgi:hypothetical protein